MSTTSKPKALVVLGQLTGSGFANAAFSKAALEAERDFKRLGYEVVRVEQPSRANFRALMSDPNLLAFCFVGHGGSKGDSSTPRTHDPHGNDKLYLRPNNYVTSSDIKRWRRSPGMNYVILHACYQGRGNTKSRWLRAFNVKREVFYSWWELCRYYNAYWAQKIF